MEKTGGVRRQASTDSGISESEATLSFDIAPTIEQHLEVVIRLKDLEPQIAVAAQRMIFALRRGGKVVWMGNGGSAADSQHLAAELVGRFGRERRGLASLALTTDSSVLTSLANDYSFEHVFSRQIEALCSPKDVVIGISTSGNSANVLAGLRTARRLGAFTVALSGMGSNGITNIADVCIRVPSNVTARIQEAHILIGHMLCDWVESEFS